MRQVGRNPVGARVRTIQRGSEREIGPWNEIVGVVTDLDRGETDGAAYIYRAVSAAELDPVVVTVRVAGDASPLAPRVAALARPVDAGLQLRDIATLDEVVAQQQESKAFGSVVFGSILVGAVVFSAAGLYALMAVAVQRRTARSASVSRSAPPPARAAYRFRPCRSSARWRHHRRQQPHPAPRVARRQPDRGSPRLVGDHVRHHGGRGRAGVRRTGAPSAAYSTDRGPAAELTCVLDLRDRASSSETSVGCTATSPRVSTGAPAQEHESTAVLEQSVPILAERRR